LLVAFAGLPGTGKSTIARVLAERLGATWLRIDTIEQAIGSKGPEGYIAGYALARDNLRIGRPVIADSVNSLRITRDAWRDVALAAQARFVEVETICSDKAEHRRRVETRTVDVPGLKLPTWVEVMSRKVEPWDRTRILVDTAGRGVEACVGEIMSKVSS
jgi:predicted kinase